MQTQAAWNLKPIRENLKVSVSDVYNSSFCLTTLYDNDH